MRLPLLAAVSVALAACDAAPPPSTATSASGPGAPPATATAAAPPVPARDEPLFEDVTEASGVAFVHDRGADGRRYLPETMGSGGCVLDADGDGLLDLYLVQSGPVPGSGSRSSPQPNRLFRNLGGFRFEDVTAASGAGDLGYGMGATCADYDADGDPDIFVANFGPDALLRNDGAGRFTSVARSAGVEGGAESFGSSAAFLDGDGDGHLDLFVVNYVLFTVATHVTCRERGELEAYCHPDVYEAAPDDWYRNRGDGTFVRANAEAGIADADGKGLGIVVSDVDGDADPDVLVANDSTPNHLWLNRGDGTFEEAGLRLGFALSEDGKALAGMGIDAGDLDGDGRLDVIVTNFAAEPNTLSINGPRGFRDGGRAWGIHGPSLPMLGFGADFLDVDCDADVDLLVANGHIVDNIAQADASQSYAQAGQVFLNDGRPPLRAANAGSLAAPVVARGTMTWDPDSDGRLDVVVTASGGPARLHRNAMTASGHWIGFMLQGRSVHRDGIGARVTVEAGGRAQSDERRAGSSYLTSGDPRVHFGLGSATAAKVTVRWSRDVSDVHASLAADRYWLLAEGAPPVEMPR